jgi:hypothetical protein
LSACKGSGVFLNYPFNGKYQARLFSAGTGVETSVEKPFKFAKRVKNLERAYCVREGMTREADSLPKRFMDNPLQEGPFQGAVLESSKFEEMKSKYYALRGWDIATGIPTRETLEQTELGDVAKDLGKRGKLAEKSPEGQSKIEWGGSSRSNHWGYLSLHHTLFTTSVDCAARGSVFSSASAMASQCNPRT